MSAYKPLDREVRQGQQLLNDVVKLFVDLVAAAGATQSMINKAVRLATDNPVQDCGTTVFTELGDLQRDCMEVMCVWRRDPSLLDSDGMPHPLTLDSGTHSFSELCKRAGCRHEFNHVLRALHDFGAVSIQGDGTIVSETPTFLLGRAATIGRLATDGLLKQLEGFLRVIHRNVTSVRGEQPARFERACTVSVAIELEPIFDQLVRERGQVFVDSVDEWLERHRRDESPSGKYRELGAGVYYIDLGECKSRFRTR